MDTENVASNYAQIRVNNQPAGTHPPNYDAHMQRVNRQVSQPEAGGAQTDAQIRQTEHVCWVQGSAEAVNFDL